jgi:hypothetical protein
MHINSIKYKLSFYFYSNLDIASVLFICISSYLNFRSCFCILFAYTCRTFLFSLLFMYTTYFSLSCHLQVYNLVLHCKFLRGICYCRFRFILCSHSRVRFLPVISFMSVRCGSYLHFITSLCILRCVMAFGGRICSRSSVRYSWTCLFCWIEFIALDDRASCFLFVVWVLVPRGSLSNFLHKIAVQNRNYYSEFALIILCNAYLKYIYYYYYYYYHQGRSSFRIQEHFSQAHPLICFLPILCKSLSLMD